MSSLNPRPMYYSRIYLDPKDPNRVYIMGSNRGFYVSDDGGRTFRDIFSGVHGEDHALWIDPDNTNRLVIGGDGGVSISFDRGLTWLFRLNLPIGQFYNISANNQRPVPGLRRPSGQRQLVHSQRLQHEPRRLLQGRLQYRRRRRHADASSTATTTPCWSVRRTAPPPPRPGQHAAPDHRRRAAAGTAARPAAYRWYWTTPLIVSTFQSRTPSTPAPTCSSAPTTAA